ncbi:hypothetical protein ACFJIY_21670 [Pimelobacter simplex]
MTSLRPGDLLAHDAGQYDDPASLDLVGARTTLQALRAAVTGP